MVNYGVNKLTRVVVLGSILNQEWDEYMPDDDVDPTVPFIQPDEQDCGMIQLVHSIRKPFFESVWFHRDFAKLRPKQNIVPKSDFEGIGSII